MAERVVLFKNKKDVKYKDENKRDISKEDTESNIINKFLGLTPFSILLSSGNHANSTNEDTIDAKSDVKDISLSEIIDIIMSKEAEYATRIVIKLNLQNEDCNILRGELEKGNKIRINTIYINIF